MQSGTSAASSSSLSFRSTVGIDAIITDTAPYPYTLGTFIQFLAQNHCLEILEFVLETRRYRKNFETLQDSHGSYRLWRQWRRIIQAHIAPGAEREINISQGVKETLLRIGNGGGDNGGGGGRAPDPNVLDPALQQMYELVHDSIMLPYLNSCKDLEGGWSTSTSGPDSQQSGSENPPYQSQQRRTTASDIFPVPSDVPRKASFRSQSHSRRSWSPSQSQPQPSSSVSTNQPRPSNVTFPSKLAMPSSSRRGSASSGTRSMQTTVSDNTAELTRTKTTPSKRAEGSASVGPDAHAHLDRTGSKKNWWLRQKGELLRHFRRSSSG